MGAVRQAIIPAGGLGTGMAPFSMGPGKELAPIGTVPSIQWIIEEGFAAGLSHFAVVLSPGKEAMRHYLTGEMSEKYSQKKEGRRWLDLRSAMRIDIVQQPRPEGLGDALLRGWRALDADLPTATLYPDNIISASEPLLPSLIRAFAETGKSVVACQRDQPFLLGNNYVVAGEQLGTSLHEAKDFTRKSDDKPDGLIWRAVGRAVLTPQFFEELTAAAQDVSGRELDDVDGYRPLAGRSLINCTPPMATIHDSGSAEGYEKLWRAYLEGTLQRFGMENA